MHVNDSANTQLASLDEAIAQLLGRSCGFGICRSPATRIVITRTAIGHRVEVLCDQHARRRAELEHELGLEDAPIPYSLTASGRAAIALLDRAIDELGGAVA